MSLLAWIIAAAVYARVIAIVARCCAINRLDDGAPQ